MGIRKLHGAMNCLGTMRALASLLEHEVEFDFVLVDVEAGANLTESFLSISPFGEVPVYQDAELTVFESRALMRYISHDYVKPGIKHIYMQPLLQGVVASWIDVGTHQFEPPAQVLLSELIEKPNSGQPTDTATVAKAQDMLATVLDVYQKRLSESPFLGGEIFTSADLTLLPCLHKLMSTSAKNLIEQRPSVKRWCGEILGRPAWAKVVEMLQIQNPNTHI